MPYYAFALTPAPPVTPLVVVSSLQLPLHALLDVLPQQSSDGAEKRGAKHCTAFTPALLGFVVKSQVQLLPLKHFKIGPPVETEHVPVLLQLQSKDPATWPLVKVQSR